MEDKREREACRMEGAGSIIERSNSTPSPGIDRRIHHPHSFRFLLLVRRLWIWAWWSWPRSRAAAAAAASPAFMPWKAIAWAERFEFLRCNATTTSSYFLHSEGRGESGHTLSRTEKQYFFVKGLPGGVISPSDIMSSSERYRKATKKRE
jgi:hypothetical protein